MVMEVCAAEGCYESHKNEHQWHSTAAHKAGWFQQRSGEWWCPEHVPAWVEDWRRKKQR